MTLGSDGNFYGAAGTSIDYDTDIAFKVTTNGILTMLVYFLGDGNNPTVGSDLTLGRDGNFYCAGNGGRLCELSTNGTLTTLASFGAGFEDSLSDLTMGTDGNFYFTEYLGGSVFRLTTNGVLTTFASVNGGILGNLTLGSDGNFYGTSVSGGIYGAGTVFEVTSNGTSATLVSIDSYYWESRSALTQGSDGNFYGTSLSYSPSDGLIFTALIPLTITVQPQSQTNHAGMTTIFSTSAVGPSPVSNPLNYQWQKNGTNLVNGGNVSGVASPILTIIGISDNDAAIYSVVVSNSNSSVTSSNAVLTVDDSPFIVTQPLSQTVVVGSNV